MDLAPNLTTDPAFIEDSTANPTLIDLPGPTDPLPPQSAEETSIFAGTSAPPLNDVEAMLDPVLINWDVPMPLDDDDEVYTDQELLRVLEESDTDVTTDGESDSDDPDTPEAPPRAVEWSHLLRSHRIPGFTEQHGLKQNLNGKSPVDFFYLLFTLELFQYLVNNINKYARRLLNESVHRCSRIKRFKDITVKDMKIFLGLLFNMGSLTSFEISNYWKTDELFHVPVFAKYMSRDKFLLILRCLNFARDDSPQATQSQFHERMSKISSLTDYFNDIMHRVYSPDKILCIDESLVLFRGRLWIRQYLKGKKNKYGIKLYLLTDQFGLVQKVIVYGGKNDPELGGRDHVNKVVKSLLSGKLGVGHSIYMDNYYNSVGLAEYLVRNQTHVTGTLRANRKGIPSLIVHKKLCDNEKVTLYNVDGVSITKWKDRREILMISSEHSGNWEEHTTRRNQLVRKPSCVLKYNEYMGGIDKHDQMMAYYNCEHKTLRWYKKLGIHLLQMLLINSHNLYNRFGEKSMPLADYRTIIIRHLLRHDVVVSPAPANSSIHSINRLPRSEKNNKRFTRKRCVNCYKNKKRVDVTTFCPVCPNKPGLCMGQCFDEYHRRI